MNKIIEYRKNHPRCRYCKYLNTINLHYTGVYLYKCILKDKYMCYFWKIRGCFCDYFEPENLDG